MRLFHEPTYRERAAEFAGDVAERVSHRFSPVGNQMPDVDDAEFGRGLGWASIGIGLTEILAPGQVNNLLGLEDTPDRRGALRVFGVRELAQGISILTEDRANETMEAGVFARVAGDMIDSVALGVAATKTKRPFQFAVVTAMVLGIGLADALCAKRLAQRNHGTMRTRASRRLFH
jgi:hypothetical protein